MANWQKAKSQAMTPEEMSEALLWVGEQLAPILDFVDGLKSDLTRRGWSYESVDRAGLEILTAMIQGIFSGRR